MIITWRQIGRFACRWTAAGVALVFTVDATLAVWEAGRIPTALYAALSGGILFVAFLRTATGNHSA